MNRAGVFSLILLLVPQLASAIDHDLQLWTEAGVRFKINKQLRLKFDQHFRLDQNISHAEKIMPELAISYRPLKFLRLEVGYRYIAEPFEDQGESYANSWHRFFADLRLRLRLKPITLRWRLRFQEQLGWIYDQDTYDTVYQDKHTIRNKLEAELKYPGGFQQFVSAELFNRFADDVRAWHKLRMTMGLEYSLASHKFTVFYRLEMYLFDDDRGDVRHGKGDMNHIMALGYHFSF